MIGPEYREFMSDVQIATIRVAEMLTGLSLPYNRGGFDAAVQRIQEQHEQVQPPFDRLEMQRMTRMESPVVEASARRALIALGNEDYESCFVGANHIDAFGGIDYNDRLGGKAFGLSVAVHRAMAKDIVGKYKDSDPFLQDTYSRNGVFGDILLANQRQDWRRSHELTRGLVNYVALHGTLGERVKRVLDPQAIVIIERR